VSYEWGVQGFRILVNQGTRCLSKINVSSSRAWDEFLPLNPPSAELTMLIKLVENTGSQFSFVKGLVFFFFFFLG
jgi:hypothetical protein